MPVSVTEHFKIDPTKFSKTGAFDSLLDQDTHLFIDPFLLEGTSLTHFQDAREILLGRFREVIKLLAASKQSDMVEFKIPLGVIQIVLEILLIKDPLGYTCPRGLYE